MARRTVLVCDNCGNEVGENKGAALRVTFTDARRGSKVADLCDACAAEMPGRPPLGAAGGRRPRPPDRRSAEACGAPGATVSAAGPDPRFRAARRRMPLPALFSPGARPGVRPGTGLRWLGESEPRRGARERGQGRAPARALSGPPRRRAVSDRAEPVGRRPGRARPAAALRLPARRLDRDVRRSVRADRRRRPGAAGRSATDAQRALVARRAVERAAARGSTASRGSARFRGFADSLLGDARRARVRARRPGRARRRARRALRRVPRRARPARALGPRPAPPPRRRAAPARPRRLARRARLRVRLRGPDRGRVVAARGARRARRGARLAAVRAGPGRVRLAARNGRGPRRARRRAAPRSCRRAPPSTPRRRSRTSSARCSSRRRRAVPPIDGAVRFLEGAGTRGTLELVGEEVLELLRAGTPAGGDRARRRRRSTAGAAPLETVFSALGIPYAIEGRVAARARRRSATRSLSLLRFAWGGAGRRELYAFLRSPYSGIARDERRLRRGPAARPRRARARPRRGGDRAAARGAARRAARAARRRVAGRRRPRAAPLDAPLRLRARRAAAPARPRGSTCAPSAAATALLDELDDWRAARRAARRRTT